MEQWRPDVKWTSDEYKDFFFFASLSSYEYILI